MKFRMQGRDQFNVLWEMGRRGQVLEWGTRADKGMIAGVTLAPAMPYKLSEIAQQ